jgi:hypothetical protein
MIGGLLKVIGGLVVALVLLAVGMAVLGAVFGIAVGLLGLALKLLPFLLVGWVILKLVRSGERRRSIGVHDQRWLDSRR